MIIKFESMQKLTTWLTQILKSFLGFLVVQYAVAQNSDGYIPIQPFFSNESEIQNQINPLNKQRQPLIYWGYCHSEKYENEIVPVSIDAKEIRVILPNRGNAKGTVKSWRIQIGSEHFEFNGPKIPEFVPRKLKIQKSLLVACPVQVTFASENQELQTIQDTIHFANRTYLGDYTTRQVQIIEKNDANFDALFNPNNELSLINFIKNNRFTHTYFMSPNSVERNMNRFDYNYNYYVLGHLCDLPLINHLGKDSTDLFGSLVYPDREMMFYDLYEITHLLVVQEESANNSDSTKQRTRLILAKKYEHDRLELVLSLDMNDFLESTLGNVFRELSQAKKDEIWHEHSKILSILKTERDKIEDSLSAHHYFTFNSPFDGFEYFPYDRFYSMFHFYDFRDYSHVHSTIDRLEFAKRFTFDYQLSQLGLLSIHEKIDFLDDYKARLNPHFRNIRFLDYSEGYPNPLYDVFGNLIEHFYPEEFYYAFSKEVNVYQVMQFNETRDSIVNKALFFTVNHQEYELAYLLFFLPNTEEWSALRNYKSIAVEDFPWKQQLESAISKAKTFNPNNPRDLKKLDKLFYLDSYEGLPVNLLNVCVDRR